MKFQDAVTEFDKVYTAFQAACAALDNARAPYFDSRGTFDYRAAAGNPAAVAADKRVSEFCGPVGRLALAEKVVAETYDRLFFGSEREVYAEFLQFAETAKDLLPDVGTSGLYSKHTCFVREGDEILLYGWINHRFAPILGLEPIKEVLGRTPYIMPPQLIRLADDLPKYVTPTGHTKICL